LAPADASLVAADCDSFATACSWDLNSRVVSPVGRTEVYLVFTAPTTGAFQFTSSSRSADANPYGYLYDSEFNLILYDDDSGGDYNFRISADLVAGEDYYLVVSHFSNAQSGSFTVNYGAAAACSTRGTACAWDLTQTVFTFTGARPVTFFKFTAGDTGGFWITVSNQTYNFDFNGWIETENDEVHSDAAALPSGGLQVLVDLIGGNVYYLGLQIWDYYASGSATLSIGTAGACGSFGTACQWDLSPKHIAVNEPKPTHLKFTAPRDGEYVFSSSQPQLDGVDPWARLWNDQFESIVFNDNGGGYFDFKITEELTAGKVYYLVVGWQNVLNTDGFTVSVKVPEATDGDDTKPPGGDDTKPPGGGDTKPPGGDVTKPPGGDVTKPPPGGDSSKPLMKQIKKGIVKIAGKLKLGKTLKAKVSKFTKGVKYSYTWYRNGKKIKGATKATYKLKKADLGKKIKVTVTAKKTGMLSANATSKAKKVPKKK